MDPARHGLTTLLYLLACTTITAQHIEGEQRIWHRITLTFDGPEASENGEPNPFTDYRLVVTFTQGETSFQVPGYFAADGNAAETGAVDGDQWRVHFTPDSAGEWNYNVAFHAGTDIAVSGEAGEPVNPHGMTGSFTVGPTNKQLPDNRARGRLQYVGEHYLLYAHSGAYFLKSGADAPETLLAYRDFDGTTLQDGGFPLKTWQPHVQDWQAGDPVWRDSLGKGLIGAINYLASEGQNAFSFLPMNINGDGRNVWPYINPDERDRFDCSKLDQWEIVFDHADKQGMFLHFKTQETENDQLLDGGALGHERKLYYRELIARFGHHLALNWNLGEENTNTTEQRKAFAQYIKALDPYDHHIVIHSFPNQDDQVYTPLLGTDSELTGASLQVDWEDVYARTREWVQKSQQAGKPWVVCNDEQGTSVIGVPDDAFAGMPSQADIRKRVLWGNLMAGGAGVEYYFGYALPHSDLSCEDFRSRDRMWDYNRHALRFFEQSVPFWRMSPANGLISGGSGQVHCLAEAGDTYLIYLVEGGSCTLDLQGVGGMYAVSWYDPVDGGELQKGSVGIIDGGGLQSIGMPPTQADRDWAALVSRIDSIPETPLVEIAPLGCSNVHLITLLEPGVFDSVCLQTSVDGTSYTTHTSISLSQAGSSRRVFWAMPVLAGRMYYRCIFSTNAGTEISVSKQYLVPCFAPGMPSTTIDRRTPAQQHN